MWASNKVWNPKGIDWLISNVFMLNWLVQGSTNEGCQKMTSPGDSDLFQCEREAGQEGGESLAEIRQRSHPFCCWNALCVDAGAHFDYLITPPSGMESQNLSLVLFSTLPKRLQLCHSNVPRSIEWNSSKTVWHERGSNPWPPGSKTFVFVC